ncbi:hypothetical protein, partial [Pseudomonas aeruginosa]|uniref:hypothetical protein n=1 Tax=Pseudomonas aeruginosa TaxID=287 RepID=UPI00397DE546
DFPGKSTGVGCHFLFQGIFPTQESNPGLTHCRQILYYLSQQRAPIQALFILFNQLENLESLTGGWWQRDSVEWTKS